VTTPRISSDRLDAIVSKFSSAAIMVVGDVMLDEYLWGDVRRISPEAPVPVVEVETTTVRLGGAANVVRNVGSLGAKTMLVAAAGRDDTGRRLSTMLMEAGCDTAGLYFSVARPTTIKTRIIARGQQVVRADRELVADLSGEELAVMKAAFDRFLSQSSAVIVSDYAKGVVCAPLLSYMIERCRNTKTFVAVDPKERHFDLYNGVSVITPNLREAHQVLGIPQPKKVPDEDLEPLGWKIVDHLDLSYLLLTLSERGMALFERSGRTCTMLPTMAQKVFDVTGAGDTVISVFTTAMACGATPVEAASIANHAAGLTVAELGTAAVTPEQLTAACLSY